MPALPEALQLQAWIELSCVLADSQKARAAPRGRGGARAGAPAGRPAGDRFLLYHALCRAASAAAQADDLAAARARLDESQALEDRAWPAQRRSGARRPRSGSPA